MPKKVTPTELEDSGLGELTVTMVRDVAPGNVQGSSHNSALVQTEGPGAPASYPLGEQDLVIGRSSNADLSVDSSEVSRRHIRIRRSGEEYVVVDLGSHNGTYLNGLKIRSATLREGDVIQIGNVKLFFQEKA